MSAETSPRWNPEPAPVVGLSVSSAPGPTAAGTARARAVQSAWVFGPWRDVLLIAFNWVPYYLLLLPSAAFLATLRHVGEEEAYERAFKASMTNPWLVLTLFITVTVISAHRDQTFLVVFGDGKKLRERDKKFYITPLLAFGIPLVGVLAQQYWVIVLGFSVLIVTDIQHFAKQSYGLMRAYAMKAKGGLETPEHARRDYLFIWALNLTQASLVVAVLGLDVSLNSDVFKLTRYMSGTWASVVRWAPPLFFGTATLVTLVRLMIHERKAELSWAQRATRLSYIAGRVLLTATVIVNTNMFGFVFGTILASVSHSVEYSAFVVAHQTKVYAKQPDNRGLAARIFRRPRTLFPVYYVVLLALYWGLNRLHNGLWVLAPFIAVYFIGNRVTHTLYDAWIWRKPSVRRGLEA